VPGVNRRLEPASSTLLIAALLALIPIGGIALLATGQVGPLVRPTGVPADADLVLSAFWHSLLGCGLSSVQWGAGAGLALWFHRENPSLARLMLLGFPLSLLLVFAGAYLVLALPFGWIAATAGLLACFASFARRPPALTELQALSRVGMVLVPPSVLLGSWMVFLAHGPTATLRGQPFGDLGFYASLMYSLESQPLPLVNYSNEGEVLAPLNMLHSMMGASLLKFFTIDPYQFVLAAGGSMYVFGFGLALYAYLSQRSGPGTRLPLIVLSLACFAATRYPFWVVESPPVIMALPLAIAVWYRTKTARTATQTIGNFGLAVAGTALSKVTSAVTLAPLSLAPLLLNFRTAVREFQRLPLLLRGLGILVIAAGALYAAFLLLTFGPLMLSTGGIAPESYQWAFQYHAGRRVVLPFLLRDVGTILLAVLAFRLLAWPYALALAIGLASALLFPFVMRINLPCAGIIIALAGIDDPRLLRRSRWLALIAFLFCLPAVLLTDVTSGRLTSVIWLLCMGAMVFVVSGYALAASATGRLVGSRSAAVAAALFSLLTCFALVAVARQQFVFAAPANHLALTPEVRDIWSAVRLRTPQDALIFTDQTSTEWSRALGGWNTYATTGQRQIFIAGWYQSPEIRQSPQLLPPKLARNEAVLSGRVRPTALPYRRGPYSAYFAVVDRGRTMPSAWQKTYENPDYALYVYHPAPAVPGSLDGE
jgi:hypothetical protein